MKYDIKICIESVYCKIITGNVESTGIIEPSYANIWMLEDSIPAKYNRVTYIIVEHSGKKFYSKGMDLSAEFVYIKLLETKYVDLYINSATSEYYIDINFILK